MYRYLFIFEDWTIWKANDVSDSDKQSADDGVLCIIDTAGDQPLMYDEGEWHGIDAVSTATHRSE